MENLSILHRHKFVVCTLQHHSVILKNIKKCAMIWRKTKKILFTIAFRQNSLRILQYSTMARQCGRTCTV